MSAKDLRNTCPSCQAAPGQPCVTAAGKPTTPHLSRIHGVPHDGRSRLRPKH